MPPRRRAQTAVMAPKSPQEAPESHETAEKVSEVTPACVGRFYEGVTPERPTRWALFFAARPEIPKALLGTTKSGKPKKHPPRLPPNINERRAMHPMVEKKTVAYWREGVPREVRRQHGMRPLKRARISAVIYRRNLGVADASGDAERIKPLVDGLVDAGVLPNDRRSEVEYGEITEEHIGYRGMGVLLIVEEVLAPRADDRAEG